MIYNDTSVLENHHCYTAFVLVKKHKLLDGVCPEEKSSIRQTMISAILGTDMVHHFSHCSKLEARLANVAAEPIDASSDEDRKLVIVSLLHAADIGNVAKPWKIAKKWAKRVSEEFFAQGDRERELGLPVEEFMDRTKTNWARTSSGFAKFVALKYFKLVSIMLGEPAAHIRKIIMRNITHLEHALEME